MLMKISHYLFIISLLTGTILACSSSSWMIAWIGLEINLMSLIPLLINKLTPQSMEMSIKYFLIQAMASMLIIFPSTMISMKTYSNMVFELNLLLTMALCLKAGVAPLHFWFPQIMEFTNWTQAIIILTWQKIAPLILLSYCSSSLLYLMIMTSAGVGAIGGINQLSMKKILTYSSIIHSSWLITIIMINDMLWWNYFLSYSFMVVSVCIPLYMLNLDYLNNINTIKLNLKSKMLMFLNLLSLAGLPPFLGFFLKLISLNSMIIYNMNIMIIISLITSSLVAFYFYSRIMYSSFLINPGKNKTLYITYNSNEYINKMITLSLMGNMLISFLVLLT